VCSNEKEKKKEKRNRMAENLDEKSAERGKN
jgi:hypothetical protein